MSLNRAELALAVKINERLKAGYADYLAECESYRQDGYTPHYCEHGTNRWTDYDNICGGCEDGLTMGDPRQRMQHAIDTARFKWESARKIAEAAKVLSDLGIEMDYGPVWKRMSVILEP